MDKARIGGVIFCDRYQESEDGRLDAYNIFTGMRVWAYPTELRLLNVIVTLYNFPVEEKKITVSIKPPGAKQQEEIIGSSKFKRPGENISGAIAFPLIYSFKKPGLHVINFRVDDTNYTYKTVIAVTTEAWPTFTKKELKYLLEVNSIPRGIRMNIVCGECESPRIFEATPLENYDYAENVFPFPETGRYVCTCGHELDLKDLEGQALTSLKILLNQVLGRKK